MYGGNEAALANDRSRVAEVPNVLGGRWQPRSAHKLTDRCWNPKVSIAAKLKEARPELREGSEADTTDSGLCGAGGKGSSGGDSEASGVWPKLGGAPDARKGRGLGDPALGGAEPGLETGPGSGAERGRAYRVGVPIEVGLGGGAWRVGVKLEKPSFVSEARSGRVPRRWWLWRRRRWPQPRPDPPFRPFTFAPLAPRL